MNNIKQALVTNGFFSFATDVEEVFRLVKGLIESAKHFVNIHEAIHQNGVGVPPRRTNFEIKKKNGRYAFFAKKYNLNFKAIGFIAYSFNSQ